MGLAIYYKYNSSIFFELGKNRHKLKYLYYLRNLIIGCSGKALTTI